MFMVLRYTPSYLSVEQHIDNYIQQLFRASKIFCTLKKWCAVPKPVPIKSDRYIYLSYVLLCCNEMNIISRQMYSFETKNHLMNIICARINTMHVNFKEICDYYNIHVLFCIYNYEHVFLIVFVFIV